MRIPRRAAAIIGALVLCVSAGAVCAALHLPLPWMIGSMLGMAAAQMSGARLEPLPWGRAAGMMTVGVSLGLYFTAPIVRQVGTYWPWFVTLGFLAIGAGVVSALVLTKLSGVNFATAYFGSMPGGAAEMANMGDNHGAAHDRVALAHSVRMLLVVTVFPIGITLAGFHATDEYKPIVTPFDGGGLAIHLAVALAAGIAARLMRLPTAFMMGPLFATIAMTVSGHSLSSMPTPVVNAAQVLLGCAMGARFERSFLSTAPRFLVALIPSVLVMLTLAAVIGALISLGSGAYLGSGLLVAAPGGIAEMSITAKVLRIGVAFVTAGHVMRYLIVVIFTIPVYRLLVRARAALEAQEKARSRRAVNSRTTEVIREEE